MGNFERQKIYKKVTLQDIADELNVSKSLVSLALSNSDQVSSDTRAKIILTALNKGYSINKRQIRSQQNEIFSLVCRDSSYLNTFFWTEVIKSMEICMAESGIGLDLVLFKDDNMRDNFLIDAIDKKTRGLIIIADCDDERYETFAKARLPIVAVDSHNYLGFDCDSISASNYNSGYLAAEYLISKGHRNLCFVGAVQNILSFKKRRAGFCDGIKFSKVKGISYREIIDNPTDEDCMTFSAKKVKKMLSGKNLPTAIMCVNDISAVWIHNMMLDVGLSCPQDISLIGFDNIEYDDDFIKELTTFDIPKQEMGRMAVKMMLNRIKRPDLPKQNVEICARLLERNSVKDLNGNS